MSLSTLIEVLRGRRTVVVSHRTREGLVEVATGRLERSEAGLLLVEDDKGQLHRIHTHDRLVVQEVGDLPEEVA